MQRTEVRRELGNSLLSTIGRGEQCQQTCITTLQETEKGASGDKTEGIDFRCEAYEAEDNLSQSLSFLRSLSFLSKATRHRKTCKKLQKLQKP